MTTTTGTLSSAAAATRLEDPAQPQTASRDWLVVAAAMFVIGWGGNEFTPLLVVYRQVAGYSAVSVDVFLGAYVLGLIPGLLLAPALSDRRGRRPVMLVGVVASMLGSGVLAVGGSAGAAALIGGRLLSGLAIGIAMAVGTAWVNELSTVPGASDGAGARRSSIALTLGLGVGPGVAGLLAQWGPLPLVLPYLVQIAAAAPVLVLLWRWATETVQPGRNQPLRHALPFNSLLHRRFLLVVLPMAPWIFGSAGIAYAIVPQLVDAKVGHWALLFTTALTVATLATGLAVQPVAKRLDDESTARAVFMSMVLMSAGVVGAALTAETRSPWLAGPVALMLGSAYGIALVSGLLEVQRIARPGELAGLTGIYYALAYVGFLLPAALAALAKVAGYPLMLAVLAAVAIGCTGVISTASRKHLPVR